MIQLLQLTIGGIAIGCVYALIALGFVLIYKATEMVNFAQGELMMLGGFVALTLVGIAGLPWWVGLVGAVSIMGLFGMALDRVVLRPMLGQPQFAVITATIAIGFIARGLVSMFPAWGTDTHGLRSPFSGTRLSIGGLILSGDHLAVIGFTACLCLLLWLFFSRTRIGIAMQACSQNQLAAHYMGIPVEWINTLAWGISAAVAGLAAVLLAPLTFVHVNMGFLGFKAFPAAVIGGLGSIPGAVAGGILLGIVESLSGFYAPEGVKEVIAYLVVLAVLIVRPSGLFGETTKKKV